MLNGWSDRDAAATVDRYAADGVNEDLALRVYTSRLLGGEPRLVLHGGGNTSVKTVVADAIGDMIDVLCVKGSGWDLASIEPAGLPAVRHDPLRKLAKLDALSDEDMVNIQRGNLLDSAAPNPSIETLLHAFLPHKFIDHTHASAVLALTDQPDGDALCAEVFGDGVILVPYIMPGFTLAKAAHFAIRDKPDATAMILMKHGVFTFGETARAAYDGMIDLVTRAEQRVETASRESVAVALPASLAPVAEVAPILRGLAGQGGSPRQILEFRNSAAALSFVNGADLPRYGVAGVVTPDHTLRTKPRPLILPPPAANAMDEFKHAAATAMTRYRDDYRDYFARHNATADPPKTRLDPTPRIILIPGLGLFALGKSAADAKVSADIAESAAAVIVDAEAVGRFESITEAEMFAVEYWSLEQAKLAGAKEKPLARHVVAVTGGAGAIGRATAIAFAAAGAEVAVVDIDGPRVSQAAEAANGVGITCDVTDPDQVAAAFDRVAEAFGGVDILVSNAGAVWQGAMAEVSEADLRASFELNFFAHQTVAQRAVAIMRTQGTGGVLLFNASKQAVNPGRDLGPYGLPKAATLALARQYALEYGADGIRANAVNADRIRGGLLNEEMIAARAAAREVSTDDYMAGNLLHREVTAEDVADAFVSLALAYKTTGATLTVDGGNIAAALR